MIGAVLSVLASLNTFSTWNNKATDALYGGTPSSNIIIVAIDDRSLQEIGRWPWQRDVYPRVINALTNAKVIAFDIAFFEPTAQDALLQQSINDKVILAKEYDYRQQLFLSPTINATTGTINIYTDQDGVSRRLPATINGEKSLSLAAAEKYLGTTLTPPEQLLINFAGKPYSYMTVPLTDLINGRVKFDFTDKIILVGATAPDLHDDYIVPTSGGQRMPGVEIHAHAIQTIITKKYLAEQSNATLMAVIMAIALLVGLLYAYVPIRYSVAVILAALFVYVFIAVTLFKQGTIVNLIFPPVTLVLASVASIGAIAREEQKHKQHILGIFGKYVSKDVVTHLLKNEKSIELGGQERVVTAMFADIRGFTSLAEKMTAHEVISFLNHYFGDMTDLVFKHEGTLDKFIGDALFAIWGSPLPDNDHALKAVSCALEIQHRLRTQHRKDMPRINLGIGICSGPAVIGNMGSKQRQEFTAIGDTINTASRLSGITEGGQIVITESTYKLIKEKANVKKLPAIKVKGKEKELIIYEVLSLK